MNLLQEKEAVSCTEERIANFHLSNRISGSRAKILTGGKLILSIGILSVNLFLTRGAPLESVPRNDIDKKILILI